MALEARRPDGPLFRLGRRPDAWQPPDWFLAHSDGTFGNRFDDPDGYYRVLYPPPNGWRASSKPSRASAPTSRCSLS